MPPNLHNAHCFSSYQPQIINPTPAVAQEQPSRPISEAYRLDNVKRVERPLGPIYCARSGASPDVACHRGGWCEVFFQNPPA
jgi:hypothetical protein